MTVTVPHPPLELLVAELEEIGIEGSITEKLQLHGAQGRFLSAGELGLVVKQIIIVGQNTDTIRKIPRMYTFRTCRQHNIQSRHYN